MCHDTPQPPPIVKTLEDADQFFQNMIIIWEAGGGKMEDLASVALTYSTLYLATFGSPGGARLAFESVLRGMVRETSPAR